VISWYEYSSNDSVNGNWTYTYDNFGRLNAANCNAPYTCAGGNGTQTNYTYAYDPFGNRWQQNVAAGQGYSVQLTFGAYNHINCCGVTWDSAGHMSNDGLGNSYTYDAEGRLLQVGTSTDSFIYDSMGHRVSKVEGSYSAQYLYDLQGHQVTALNPTNNQTLTTEVYVGGRHWVTDNIASNYATFLHTDWLGSPHVWTNLSGGVVQTCSNLPFGDGQTCTGGQGNYFSDWHFTGQDHDFGSGEDHFFYRMYANTDGRWTTPDPAGMAAVDPMNPQSWNKYGYTNNNPVSAMDPTGLVTLPCDPELGCWTGGGGGVPACDPFEDPYCDNGCDTFEDPSCDPFGGSGQGGALPPAGGGSAPTKPKRTGGVWPDNETLGLPTGLNLRPMTLGDLLGLDPNGPCDFGVCNPIGLGFENTGIGAIPGMAQVNSAYWGLVDLLALLQGIDTSDPGPPGMVRAFTLPMPTVPPGSACNKYDSPTLKYICNAEPNSPTNNCVRGYLLGQYDPNSGYQGGIRNAHCESFAACGMSPWNPAQIAFGCYLF